MAADEHRFCLIIGAGFGGIIQACTFLRDGTLSPDDIQIIDRYGGFGGVWWKNTYPGAACDISTEIYSISWAPNPYWSRRLATQPEIQQYLEKVALDNHLDECTTFNTDVLEAVWDEEQFLWTVKTKDLITGLVKVTTCNLLISAVGQYSVPKKLDVPGIEEFHGRQWHTLDWPKDPGLEGERVAVIGTGPSAAQLLSHITSDVKQLYVYQRSSTFCVPRFDPETSLLRQWAFARFPILGRIFRWLSMRTIQYIHRSVTTQGTWWQKAVVAAANYHLDRQVHDEQTREKLRAKNKFGCKQALVLSDYYPVFNEPHVELITNPILRIDKGGIVSQDAATGKEEHRGIDVLIWATGYRAEEFGGAVPTRGRKGALLSDKYEQNMFSLYGLTVDDFPNFFNLLGPNSLGFDIHIVNNFELQAKYITAVTRYLLKKQNHQHDGCQYAMMANADRVRDWTLSLREGQAKHPAAVASCNSHYKSKRGQVYFYPYGYSQYKKLISSVDFLHDWVILARGESKCEITPAD